MSSWSTYILRCKDGSLYTGISTNVAERIKRHNAGKGAAYTRSRKPVVLVWQERAKSESMARRREAEIKKWSRGEKLKFLRSSPVVSSTSFPSFSHSTIMAKGNNAQQKNKNKKKKKAAK